MSTTDPRLEWQRTSPMAVVFYITKFANQVVTNGLPAIAGLGAVAASGGDRQRTWLLLAVVLLLVFGVLGSFLSYLRFRFRIINDRILVHSGILHREELDIEFKRVQNVTIREPFYMRPFSLALLAIDTAGSGKKEIILGGITLPLAKTLRKTILACSQEQGPDDPVSETEVPEAGLLLTRSTRDIVIYGFTINFLLWVAIAFGAISGYAEELFGRMIDLDKIKALLAMTPDDGFSVISLLITIALILAAILILPLIGVAGALIRHYGYRLTVDGETYRKHSGLLSRHDESLKQHKIQAVVWKQNFMAHMFGRINMQLRQVSAGSAIESGQLPTGSKAAFLVPAVFPAQAIDLSAQFMPGCQADQVVFSSVNRRRYVMKNLTLGWLPVITGLLTGPFILLGWMVLLLAPVLLGFGYLVVNQIWTRLGYGIVGQYGFVRSGLIGTQTTLFPLFKVQRIDIRQTPGQRRHDLANLTIHLASHSLEVPYVALQDAEMIRDLALFEMESSFQPWY